MLCVSRECIHPSGPSLSWNRDGHRRKPAHRQLMHRRPACLVRGPSQANRLRRHTRTCGALALGCSASHKGCCGHASRTVTCSLSDLPYPTLSKLVSLRGRRQVHVVFFLFAFNPQQCRCQLLISSTITAGCSLSTSVEVCCRALFKSQ